MRLLPVLAASALISASLIARADTIFNLQGTFVTDVPNGEQGGTLTGTITLNSASNGFSAIDATVTNSTNTYQFSTVNAQFQGAYDAFVVESVEGITELTLAIRYNGSLAGYSGSVLCSNSSPCAIDVSDYDSHAGPGPGTDDLFAGSVTPQAAAITPEPSSFLLLGTGLLGIAGIARRRLA